MESRRLTKNKSAVSSMYDAVLFIVMVSLSGVVLLPALQSNVPVETSVEEHRENVADEALNAFLVTRVDKFSYDVCGDVIDDVARSLGVNTSSDGLYSSITEWLLGREQLHKTYANLLCENLGCQFRIPFSVFGSKRVNIFTGDFDRQLEGEVNSFFTSYLGDKYNFNFSARWHPIVGVDFGGELFIGDKPPTVDSHVARSCIVMPYSPVLDIGGFEIVLTQHWLETVLFDSVLGFIPEFENITSVIKNYSSYTLENVTNSLEENVTSLVYGFLIDGIENKDNETVFPGILNASISYGFGSVKLAIDEAVENLSKDLMGEAFGFLDNLFSNFSGFLNPLATAIVDNLTTSIQDLLGAPVGSLNEALDKLETMVKEKAGSIVAGFLDDYVQCFIESLSQLIEQGLSDFDALMKEVKSYISKWLFERISLNKAVVTLTVWAVRE